MVGTEKLLHDNSYPTSAGLIHTNDNLRDPLSATLDRARAEKITRIRGQILGGTYAVTTMDVARAILRSAPLRWGLKKKKQ